MSGKKRDKKKKVEEGYSEEKFENKVVLIYESFIPAKPLKRKCDYK